MDELLSRTATASEGHQRHVRRVFTMTLLHGGRRGWASCKDSLDQSCPGDSGDKDPHCHPTNTQKHLTGPSAAVLLVSTLSRQVSCSTSCTPAASNLTQGQWKIALLSNLTMLSRHQTSTRALPELHETSTRPPSCSCGSKQPFTNQPGWNNQQSGASEINLV